MNKVTKQIILFVAQGAYSGKAPFAPGTAGTLVGVLLYLVVRDLATMYYILLTCLVCIVGTWASGRAEIILDSTDSPSIVIDEITGFLVAMFMVPPSWGFIVSGFILFRVLDIVKPWPLKRLQDLHGGLGVMLDDVGAGIYTNLILQAAVFFIFQ